MLDLLDILGSDQPPRRRHPAGWVFLGAAVAGVVLALAAGAAVAVHHLPRLHPPSSTASASTQ